MKSLIPCILAAVTSFYAYQDEDNDEEEAPTGNEKDDDEEEETKWKRVSACHFFLFYLFSAEIIRKNGEILVQYERIQFVRDITSERVSVKEDDGVLTLTIRRLTASDAGEYQCIVENEAGKTVRSANLSITRKSQFLL